MKRIALVLISFIGPLVLGACQEKFEFTIDILSGDLDPTEEIEAGGPPGYEEIMTLRGGNAQGGDCWGDYFFQFTATNYEVRVYDLSIKTQVQTINIPVTQRGFVSNCHCNTVCFGTEYYDVEDIFPLIYVSTGYASGGFTGALVYRITQQKGRFYVSLVQTIKFPVDNSSWTEFVPGDEFAYLCYTSERVIYKVPMPKLKDRDIIISRDDAIETYQFTPQPDWMSTSRNQDTIYYKGDIIYISGVPQAGEASAFVILNLQTLSRERIIDFKQIGLTSESESIFVWQGDLCVAFVDKIVRLVNFIDTP